MYKIIGANQVEYGPITGDQLHEWIREGRVNGQTPAQMEGETTWKPLSMFPEFASVLPATPAPASFAAGPAAADDAGRASALSAVNAPGIALIVAASIGIALAMLGILMQLMGMGMAGMENFQGSQNAEAARMVQMFSGSLGIVFRVIGILVGVFIIYGGVKMRKLESHGLCIAASIVAMIPCVSPCCCIGLPVGIWALVILSKGEVKDQFS